MFANPTQQYPSIFSLIIGMLLVLQSKYFGFSESVSNNYYRNTSGNLLRFRDFEPRSQNVANSGVGVGVDESDKTGGVREARGFQLYAEKEDLKVDIEFVVPFVRIPIKRSMQMTTSVFRNLAHLKTGPLLFSGLLLGIGAAGAALFKVFNTTPYLATFIHKKTTRNDNTMPKFMDAFNVVTQKESKNSSNSNRMVTSMNELIQSVESKFRDNDIDLQSCVQKTICQYIQDAAHDVELGKGTGLEKIIDGLTSLDSMHEFLSGTAVHKAIDTGKSSNSCSNVFPTCKWTQPANKMMELLFNYLKFLNSG